MLKINQTNCVLIIAQTAMNTTYHFTNKEFKSIVSSSTYRRTSLVQTQFAVKVVAKVSAQSCHLALFACVKKHK
jgi:hypothetical protein